MTQFVCPFCGPREIEEFTFHKTVPEPGSGPLAEVYYRVNRTDLSVEYWQHSRGCRAWLKMTRNPSTSAVLEVKNLGDHP